LHFSADKNTRSFLANPKQANNDKPSQLSLLHAFLIELGLYTPTSLPTPPSSPANGTKADGSAATAAAGKHSPLTQLPVSLTKARAALKERAFVNVKEYLAVRQQGLDALRAVILPSRSALRRSIKKQGCMSAKKVKEAGLNVFLVHVFR
jgi:hypothetical protein